MGRQREPRPQTEVIKIGKKTWRRTYKRDPWNDMEAKLELFISPTLQMRYGLPPHLKEKPWRSNDPER